MGSRPPLRGSAGVPERVVCSAGMELEFSGEMWFWKGPSPWHFITVPEDECGELERASAMVTYGWGMILVTVEIGRTRWTTSLWPKDGTTSCR